MVKIEIELSIRYGVMGLYKDRNVNTWRVYPLPFIRISIAR